MKILITGINGTVGGNLFRHFIQIPGCETWGMSRGEYKFLNLLSQHMRDRILSADLKSGAPEKLPHDYFDVVIHAAAITPKSTGRGNKFSDNQLIAENITEYLKSASSKTILLSSGSVYSDANNVCVEDSEKTTTSEYGTSMISVEQVFQRKLSDVLILRLFYPYAFDLLTKDVNLVSKILLRIKNGESISTCPSPKTSYINPIFFGDILMIIKELLDKNVSNETINVANPQPCTFYEMLWMLSVKENKGPPKLVTDAGLKKPLCADTSKLLSYINAEQFTKFGAGICALG